MMFDYEKLGKFYLGRPVDPETRATQPQPLLYDAKDLTTHAVCVGMTGSGKTGLCLTLLEEAAIDHIPAIVIDPKGDLGNLLLTFPQLRAEDFQPWIEPAEATRQGKSVEELARTTAETWRNGLAAWDQTPERIARFRDACEISIYTPGSQAGLPLTVIRSFHVPPPEILANADARRERIQGAVAGLLALLDVAGDPLRSRESVLLSTIFERAWASGRHLDLATMIHEIQKPAFHTIGVMDIESVFPAADRFDLAMKLNNLLASPGFSAWMEGEPLEIPRLLHTPTGKPRISILSLAHLSDAERMFFVTILLHEVIAWMRTLSGTSSLRALLYMDEVFGYFPPSANPPTKTPMLTLLKQARAFGVGIVLATQNPVDLDYKGLSNAGTWFLGRLQTERDKQRVLDGLEGASAAVGSGFDRKSMESLLSGLGNRVFLMNNIHDKGPIVFESRFVLSYLRGPLTREQIAQLMAPRKTSAAGIVPHTHQSQLANSTGQRPIVPTEITEVFQQEQGLNREGTLVYEPALRGTARVQFVQAKEKVDLWQDLVLVKPLDLEEEVDWDESDLFEQDDAPEFSPQPDSEGASYAAVPQAAMRVKAFSLLSKELRDWLCRNHVLNLFRAVDVKLVSRPGETESEFRARLSLIERENRDLAVEKLRAKFAPKLQQLEDRERRARQRLEREQTQKSNQVVSAIASLGAFVGSLLTSKKSVSATNIGKAASTAKSMGRLSGERQDVAQAQESLEAIQQDREQLETQIQAEIAKFDAQQSPDLLELEVVEVKLKKTNVTVKSVELAWIPRRQREK